MACSVIRNQETNEIERVLAPNGNESKLFQSLNELTKDKEQALRLWSQVYTPAFKSWFGDWELLQKAKLHADEIKGYSKDIFKISPETEKFLFEIAQQANDDQSLNRTFETYGETIFNIATTLFPNTKSGDQFTPTISKVVDENGEPLVVYHGTGIEFNSFDKSKLGSNTGAKSAEKAFFFTEHKNVAKEYIEYLPSRLKIVTPEFTNKYIGEDRLIYKYIDKIPSDYIVKTEHRDEDGGGGEISYIKPEHRKDVENLLPGIFKYDIIHDNSERNIGNGLKIEIIRELLSYTDALKHIEESRREGFGQSIFSTFLNIKNPLIFSDEKSINRKEKYSKRLDKAKELNNDGVIIKDTYDPYPILTNIYAIFNPNEIKSVTNQGTFNSKEDNIYKQIDPADYNPIEKDQKDLQASQNKNKNTGLETVETSVQGNIGAINVDEKTAEFIAGIHEADITTYKKFLYDYIYTHKENPLTSDLLNNVGRLSLTLARPDLLKMSRLLYKYIGNNPTLSTRMIDQMDEKARAYFDRSTNQITFARDKVGTGTIESESETVLHEILHGLSFQPWFKQRNDVPLTQEEKMFKNIVDGYYNYFKNLNKGYPPFYAFTNAEEFLIHSLLDNNFKQHLKLLGQTSGENRFITFFKDLFKGFLKLFGVNIDEKVIDRTNFEDDMFNALSDYLGKMNPVTLYNNLKSEDRVYGLSFAVEAEGDYIAERQKVKGRFTPQLTQTVKDTIERALLSIKSFGSTIRTRFPESQEGFQTIFRQLRKLENPEYNLDQIDFFFDFTGEISAIMNVAHNKISKLYQDDVNDADFKLKEYEDIVSSIRNFDPIIKDIQQVKIQMDQSGLRDVTKEITNMILKRGEIESIYSMGIFPLVTSKLVDILSPASKRAIEIANTNITKLNQSLALANKFNATSRIKQLEKQIKAEQDTIDKEFTLNSDKVESWLRGEMGDSNIYSTYTQAAISNPNPVISGLQKFIRDNVGEIAPQVLEVQNTMQSQIEAYKKGTGRSIDNITEFNRPLIQIHKEVTGKDENGNITYKEVLSLLHAFNGTHITDLQEYKRNLTDLYDQKREIENSPNIDPIKLAEILDKINKLQESRRQFVKDYMEQRYAPEVHEALDMMYDDLGGFTIWDYMGPLLSTIEDIETIIDQTDDEGMLNNLFDQLDDANFELRRLSSLYEKTPGTNEYKVAEYLKKRSAALTKFSEFKLTEKGGRRFEAEKARIVRKFQNKEITQARYERWFENNTVTELTTGYWEEKKSILNELNEIGRKLGLSNDKNEDLGKLYNRMEDITKAHRDNNGIINGQEMSNPELADVKSVEEEIEKIKLEIEGANGLSKGDKIALSNLHEQIREIQEKVMMTMDPTIGAQLDDMLDIAQDKIDKINSKKKNVDKKIQDQYFKLLKRLGALDETNPTWYYLDEELERFEQFKWAVDITKMPAKFVTGGKTYQKNGDNWFEVTNNGIEQKDNSFVEDIYRALHGEIALHASDWWKDNHITITKFVPNATHNPNDPSSFSGEWIDVEQPIYAWRQTRPRDPSYINEGQPSIKYKKRIIKDQYVNKNYKESTTGDVQPKLTGAKDDRYINKDYQKLVASNTTEDKATLAYLTYLTNAYLKAQESVPIPKRKGYELPSIRKTEIERLFAKNITGDTQSLFGEVGNMLRIWNDDVVRNEQDKDVLFGYNDDFTGIVPMKFLGTIDAKDQSVDLANSILAFVVEGLKREQLIKSLPFANAIKDIVNNPDYKPVKTKNGIVQTVKRKFLPKGTGLAVKSTSNNTALQINELIKTEIYGENMKDVPGAKLINNVLGVGAKLMLGLNFVSSIQNYANAFTQSIMETESKISGNFTMKNFFEAQKIYYGHIHELMSDMGKYGNKSYINQFFDYFGGINYKLYTKNHKNLAAGKLREFLSDLSLPNTVTEHMLNYHMGIAIALNYRVKAIVDGQEVHIPIFNAFVLKDRNLEVKPGVLVNEEDRKEMISRLNSSSRRINGEYGDRILADKFILGKLTLFMNRYVIPFVVKRYGSREFNIQDGVREEGYWRLFGKVLLKDLKSKSVPIFMGWKYYTQEEKNAIVRSTTEFGFSVMFFLLLHALGGDDKDKIKSNSIMVNNLIYALKGVQQQNEAFMPVPGVGFDDLFRKIQNPFPILGKMKNLVNLIQDGSHAIYYEMGFPGVDKNDVFYSKKTGWHQPGDLKVMADLEKLVALPQRIMQYMYPADALKAQDAMSRIK